MTSFHQKPWIIDEETLFAPSEKLTIQKEQVGKHKLIIIDNFYKHPEKVQELILKAPSSRWEGILYGYKGSRHMFCLNLHPMYQVIQQIIHKEFNTLPPKKAPLFQSNIIIQNKEPAGPCAQPHTDDAPYAYSIFLNSPETCAGGTAFYRHRKSGLQAYPIYKTQKGIPEDIQQVMEKFHLKNVAELRKFIYGDESKKGSTQGYIAGNNQDWELLKIAEMRFNRLTLFEGKIFHSAYISPDMYVNDYRISQVGFF